MRNGILVALLCAATTGVMPTLWAQDSVKVEEAPQHSLTIPIVRIGTMIGRDGAAFGPGFLVEVNPGRRLGLYGFVGTSSVEGYSAAGGVKANFSDQTLGFGLAYRVWSIGPRFVLAGFAQAAYYGSHVRATFPDGFGGMILYTSSDREPLVTIGPSCEFRVTHSVIVVVRPGKDFGSSFAATTAGGFSITGGVLVGVKDIAKGASKLGKTFF